jgi:hypothetical protein
MIWAIGVDITEFGTVACILNRFTRRASFERGHLRRRWLLATALGLARIAVEGAGHW